MATKIIKVLLIQILFTKVLSSYLQKTQQYYQEPKQHYYQLTGQTSSPQLQSYTLPPSSTVYQPASHSTYLDYSSYHKASPLYSSTDDFSKSNVAQEILQISKPNIVSPSSTKPVSKAPTEAAPTGFDTNVLNNLAIALQLLIVSNLLNNPLPELPPKTDLPASKTGVNLESLPPAAPVTASYAKEPYSNYYHAPTTLSDSQSYLAHSIASYSEPNLYEQTLNSHHSIPNANYVASSSLTDTGFLGSILAGLPTSSFGIPPAVSRPGLNLKSPYDMIASTEPSRESVFSPPYEYSKRDFQSPYSAILAADNIKDLFSIDFY